MVGANHGPLKYKRFRLSLQLRPVLNVSELASLTLRKLKDDNKARKIQNLRKLSRHPLSKMARVPEGEEHRKT